MRTFRVNDIFFSLQGEGRNTGRAAVFIRFAGCNLRCPFCDTEFDTYTEMTDEDIVKQVSSLIPHRHSLIILTGGEPTLQVDEAFVDLLHQHGFEVAMESNGTRPAPRNLDWLTVSPKENGDARVRWYEGTRIPDEIKVVFTGSQSVPPLPLEGAGGRLLLYLQPCDTGDVRRNAEITSACVEYIKSHPEWRLSLQTHKLIGID